MTKLKKIGALVSAFLMFATMTVFAEENIVVGVAPGEELGGPGLVDEVLEEPDLSAIYAGIPLSSEEIDLMCCMAYGETMHHDGTCPVNTVKACYEVVFNRYLYDLTSPYTLFHRGELTIKRLLTKSQFEGIVSLSAFNSLPTDKKDEYRNLVWQVHNQGPTVLTTEFLYWQSSTGTRGKDNRVWVGFIKDENGNIVEGTTTDRSCILKGRGNWYRITYK